MAKGPLHAIRGSGEQEKMLKNAKTEYFNEHEEIATYLAIETLAEKVRDSETAKLARAIRREEERMASFLQGQIKSLSGAVAREEIPAALRRAAAPKRKAKKAPTRKAATSESASEKSRRESRREETAAAKNSRHKTRCEKSRAKR